MRVQMSLRIAKTTYVSRREIKNMTRGTNICFGLVMIIMTGVLSFSYIKDELRGECREDSKYKDMRIISVITLCIVLATTFLLFFVSCKIICRAERKS